MLKRPIALLLSALFLLFCITGCKSCKSRRHRIRQADLYTTKNFSDYVIDSAFVVRELATDSALAPYTEDIEDFYQRRHYQAAWLNGGKLNMSAYNFINTLRSYQAEFGDKTLAADFEDKDIGAMLLSGQPDRRGRLELKLTAMFFRYAEKAYGGTDVDPKDLEWYIPRMKKDYQKLIDSLVASPGSYTVYEPVNAYYRALKKVLIAYRAIEKKGGLPPLHLSTLPLKKGDKNEAVKDIKKSLAITGDYTDGDKSADYTDSLATAVARYQLRMGLRGTGAIDSTTLAELSAPIGSRIEQVMLNMERLRWMPDSLPDNYILVNIPEYRLHIYEHGANIWSMDVVVGNEATATSIFTGRLSVVEFCPYWNVPQSIVKKELLPRLKENPNYLDKLNMEVVNGDQILSGGQINWSKYTNSVPFVIRQRSGKENSLGRIAFFFPNSYDIFLHDTPAKSFFSESSRAFSHGCIRLAEPEKLADYVFRNDSIRMPPDKIHDLMYGNEERKVAVRPSIPVYIGYFTAWVDPQGHINFRHDIYGHDARLAKEIFGR